MSGVKGRQCRAIAFAEDGSCCVPCGCGRDVPNRGQARQVNGVVSGTKGGAWMKTYLLLLAVGTTVGCSGTVDETTALRANIGKSACNQTNGVYRGRIVDVTAYSASGQSPELVYVVERDGRRQNAPVRNTTVAEVCLDGQPTHSGSAKTGSPAPPVADVDSNLQAVATEFSRRLRAYQGSLAYLKVSSGTLNAKWTSQRCDMTEGEVIDLLLSINRGHPAPFAHGIEAERTCGGTVRKFSAAAGRFQEYRTGRINDPEMLRGLK